MTETTETTTIQTTLANIQTLAAEVTTSAEQLAAAKAEELAAETELLDRMIALTRTSLRHLAQKIQTEHRTWWPSNCSTAEASKHLQGERGFRVAGDGAEEDHPRANAGGYEGDALYLMTDGSWIKLTYSGSWSRWQGAPTKWTAEVRRMSTAQVAAEYHVLPILQRVEARLTKRAGELRQGASDRATARAKRLRAVIELLSA